ncbi:MAG TPA: phosphopantetheine-binding protein [Stellaceae bacterium]|nr:phosphopantetheine-binding protein [Stellaceae bacterium]
MEDPRVAKILDIIAEETSVDRTKLLPEATIDDLGIASIDLIEAIFKIETVFNIDIPVVSERSGEEFSTVKGLVDHVIAALDQANNL